jgi:hypothetical protein
LQVKVTKRYSHGLDFTSAFTWAKELAQGTGGDINNNVFNRQNWKSLTNTSQPIVFTIGFNYQVPKLGSSRALRGLTGGWTVGGLLRYASGYPIPSPAASSNLGSLIYQNTVMDRVAGEPLFLKDLNCHCINPEYDLVLNPKAWKNPAPGQWGTSAGYYNDYRFSRRPDEQLSLGREFRIGERMMFSVRAEFFNVFNRLYLGDPSNSNPLQTPTKNSSGQYTAGYGFINKTALANPPRNGQIVARFMW